MIIHYLNNGIYFTQVPRYFSKFLQNNFLFFVFKNVINIYMVW